MLIIKQKNSSLINKIENKKIIYFLAILCIFVIIYFCKVTFKLRSNEVVFKLQVF